MPSAVSGRQWPDVEPGVERAHPDPHLLVGRKRPAVAGRDVAAVDPDLHLLATAARVDLEPARERGVRRLVDVAAGEHAPPAESVDDQRGGEDSAVGLDRDRTVAIRGPGAAVHLRGLEAGVAVLPDELAELAVVEGREAPGEGVPLGPVRGVHQERVEALALRREQARRPQPIGRDPAGRGLALADLVAVDHHHRGAAPGQLPGQDQTREARAADQHVATPCERGSLLPPFRRAHGHDR